MNSNQKGKRGERQWRDELRANGYEARRGQQFAGGSDSPDVVCPDLAWLHQEVKLTEKFQLRDWLIQCRADCAGKPFIIAHRYNQGKWTVTMEAETFFDLIRNYAPQSRLEAQGRVGSQSSVQSTQTDAVATDGCKVTVSTTKA